MSTKNNNLAAKLPGMELDILLAPYTSFKIGGPAKYFFIAKSNDDIAKVVALAKEQQIPFFILGNGSNILISDQGFDGLVIKMENRQIQFNGDMVSAESGASVQKLIRESISKNLSGLEFLIGIPGTVGGGVAGNIGTAAQWIDQAVIDIGIIDISGNYKKIPKAECNFSYRHSRFKNNNNEIILEANFQLERKSQQEIQKNVSVFLAKRSGQPVSQNCAGSIFKNPKGMKAWEIIDKLDLRGKKMGGARVSEDHANFIINYKNATAEDIVILISYIKQQARDKLGIQLQEEIEYIGF